MNEKIIVGTSQNFAEIIAKGVVLVDFWAAWCGPCKMLAPIIDDVASELDGNATIVKVNIDEQESLAEKYQIATIPTLVLFKDGVEVDRMVGFKQKQQVLDFVKHRK